LGIKFSNEELKKRIQERLEERLKEGMIEEVRNIVASKLASYADLERLGLEPRFIAYHLQKKINREQLEDLLLKNIYHFAKRQMTWLRKDGRIKWVRNTKEAINITGKFL
jgi:tRNA dimethylallyltransferase